MSKILLRLKPLQHLAVKIVGFKITEATSGEDLGKYIIIPWRGKLHFIGLDASHAKPFYPVFVPQQRVTYWKQTLAFRTHPIPDYPNERHGNDPGNPPISGTRPADA
jgi:hypothetical protein